MNCKSLRISEMPLVGHLHPEDLLPVVHHGENFSVRVDLLVHILKSFPPGPPIGMDKIIAAFENSKTALLSAEQAYNKSLDIEASSKLYSLEINKSKKDIENLNTRVDAQDEEIAAAKKDMTVTVTKTLSDDQEWYLYHIFQGSIEIGVILASKISGKVLEDAINLNTLAINAETLTRVAADKAISDALGEEASQRDKADKVLTGRIEEDEEKITKNANDIQTIWGDEDTKGSIKNAILKVIGTSDKSTTKYSTFESVSTKLEEIDKTSSTIEKSVASETADRKLAISELSNQVNLEATRSKSQESIIQANIDKETSRAQSSESALQSNISSEEAKRTSADSVLDHKILDLNNTISTNKAELISQRSNDISTFNNKLDGKVDKVDGKSLTSNDFTDDLKAKLDSIEYGTHTVTKTSELKNDSDFTTTALVNHLINDVIDGAPDAMNTLKELASAIGDDKNFAGTITNLITELKTKVDNEATARTDRDNLLLRNIDIEAGIRKTADELLGGTISGIQDLVNKNLLVVQLNTADIQTNTDLILKYLTNQKTYIDLNNKIEEEIHNHINNTENPHHVTKELLGYNTDTASLTKSVTPNATVVSVTDSYTDAFGTNKQGSANIPAATLTAAGVMTANDKKTLDAAASVAYVDEEISKVKSQITNITNNYDNTIININKRIDKIELFVNEFDIEGAKKGDFLYFDGSKWVPKSFQDMLQEFGLYPVIWLRNTSTGMITPRLNANDDITVGKVYSTEG